MEELTKIEQQAIVSKYESKEYAEIAREAGVSLSTVKHWFAKKGRLTPHYAAFARQLGEQRMREASARMTAMVEGMTGVKGLR